MLELILKQCENITNTEQRYTFYVFSRGERRYTVVAQNYIHTPSKVYEFPSAIGDVIVIWSLNPFLSESTAHEIAVQIGETFGCYV